MTIAQFHQLFKLVADKSGSDYFPHEQIDDLAHIAQMEYFGNLIGNYKQYQPGRPVPPVVVGQTSRSTTELNPFKAKIDFFAAPYDPTTAPYAVDNGILTLPADFEHISAVVSAVYQAGSRRDRPVQELDDEEWASRVDSSLIEPTKKDAIYRFAGVRQISANDKRHLIEFRPKDVSGHVSYYRTPAKPNYVYTLNGRVETHNASTSTDLEWGEVAAMNILVRSLQLAGIKSADQVLAQVMGQNKMSEE
jgi:hypothetical protein